MSQIKINGSSLKTDTNLTGNSVNTPTSNVDTSKGSWEFFKDILGIVTRPINQQIQIPSTAFTPDFALPTKAILLDIIKAKDMLKDIKNIISDVSNNFGNDNSNILKQKQMLKMSIGYAYKLFKNGDK